MPIGGRAKLAENQIAFPSGGRGTALAVDEVFETNEKDSSSVSLWLPPSPTGEGFFDAQKTKKSPARGGVMIRARIRINNTTTLFFRFPDACVRGKHSAWQSSHHRAEARTHYPQKHGAQKPSSGR